MLFSAAQVECCILGLQQKEVILTEKIEGKITKSEFCK